MKTNHPTKLLLDWKTNKKDLPKEWGIYAVCCENCDTKERWYTFAEFIPEKLPNVKKRFDRWKVLGNPIANDSHIYWGDNWFDVIAWSKTRSK